MMKDEGWKMLMCILEANGLVVFTGCGYAGVVDTARYEVKIGKIIPFMRRMTSFSG